MTPDDPDFTYDEFGYFDENCSEYSLPWVEAVPVRREQVQIDGRSISMLRWGAGPPEFVFLHGGAQNAHTWDTVLLAMGCPSAVCFDLPGHGHSSHRDDGRYDPRTHAATVAEALDSISADSPVDSPVVLVGMSMGGLTANALTARRPELVGRLVVIDVTPGVDRDKASEIVAFIAGPQAFASFDEILARTVEFNPTRAESSLRRGILHNAHRLGDGSWEWNYDRTHFDAEGLATMGSLWDDVASIACPVTLVRGADSPVVDDADVAEFLRLQPAGAVRVIEGAGHSIQGDRPVELAQLLTSELASLRLE